DRTAPVVTQTVSPPPNAAGWINSTATVSVQATDALSGIASTSDPVTVGTEGTQLPVVGTATDKAGNSSSRTTLLNIDRTPPSITANRAPVANGFGWNNAAVTVNFSCSDALSGIDTCPSPQLVNAEGGSQTATGTARDVAGNTASASVSGISI